MNPVRCRWCNLNNPIYVVYHDEEWGRAQHDDRMLFELLVLESFQSGLSWETVLNKRESFSNAFDGFDPALVREYDEAKVQLLAENTAIIRHSGKINAAVHNAGVFTDIQKEWGSFSAYIWHFTDGKTIYETDKNKSALSDAVSADLKHRGMKFVGSTTIYSYLQAIGIIYSHDQDCVFYRSE